MCISYNYHKKNDICELNSHGFTESCASLQEILVYAPGIVFHQLRPGKVIFIVFSVLSVYCSTRTSIDELHEMTEATHESRPIKNDNDDEVLRHKSE